MRGALTRERVSQLQVYSETFECILVCSVARFNEFVSYFLVGVFFIIKCL